MKWHTTRDKHHVTSISPGRKSWEMAHSVFEE